MKSNIVIVLMFIAMAVILLLMGCTESEQPVYGNGEPPAEYQDYFGNDNGARLDFVQNQAISELALRVQVLEGVDPNE
jgi:hypothetical protein